jgi:hypothetical protein
MNKLVYIYVQKEFVIGQVVLKLFSKRFAVAMVNKTVDNVRVVTTGENGINFKSCWFKMYSVHIMFIQKSRKVFKTTFEKVPSLYFKVYL